MEALHSRQHGREYREKSSICSHVVDVDNSQMLELK
jgi:hypothetical protein